MPKRGASSAVASGTSPRPKSVKQDSVGYRVARIQSVLKMSDQAPVSGMLYDVCDLSFHNDSEHRHPYESNLIDMIKTSVITMRQSADAVRLEKETTKHVAVTESEDFVNRLEELRSERDNKHVELRAAMEWEKKKDAELKVADSDKKKFVKEGKALYATVQRAKEAVEEASSNWECVAKLRDSADQLSEKDRKKYISEYLQPLMKRMNVDAALTNAAPIAFAKNVGARGFFDKATITQVENDYTKYFSEIKKIEQGYQPQVAANEAQEAELERKLTQAKEVLAEAKEKVKSLESQLTQLTDTQTDIAKKSQAAIKTLKTAESEFDEAKAKVQVIDESLKFIDELSQRIGDSLDAAVAQAEVEESK